MSNTPTDRLYHDSHEWAKIEGEEALVGITFFAQDQLGDITYVDLPAVGDTLEAGDEYGSIESVKAASDLFSPVSGEVIAVNEDLDADPEIVNGDPYEKGWMIRVKLSGQPSGLLSAADYDKSCE